MSQIIKYVNILVVINYVSKRNNGTMFYLVREHVSLEVVWLNKGFGAERAGIILL
jgi:hypothetical protein